MDSHEGRFVFLELPVADRWILIGNFLVAGGVLAINIGALLRLANGNSLPNQPIFSGGLNGATNQPTNSNRARDYFT